MWFYAIVAALVIAWLAWWVRRPHHHHGGGGRSRDGYFAGRVANVEEEDRHPRPPGEPPSGGYDGD
jgi:hypothetical protein